MDSVDCIQDALRHCGIIHWFNSGLVLIVNLHLLLRFLLEHVDVCVWHQR